MTTMEDFKRMRDELNKKITDEGKAALQTAFVAFFNDNPRIHALRWRQYTPYFNDGEACTFGVYEPDYQLTEHAKTYDDATDFADDEDFIDAWQSDEIGARVSAFWNATSDDDVFEVVFGDHVTVLATREGFTVAEYSHD